MDDINAQRKNSQARTNKQTNKQTTSSSTTTITNSSQPNPFISTYLFLSYPILSSSISPTQCNSSSKPWDLIIFLSPCPPTASSSRQVGGARGPLAKFGWVKLGDRASILRSPGSTPHPRHPLQPHQLLANTTHCPNSLYIDQKYPILTDPHQKKY